MAMAISNTQAGAEPASQGKRVAGGALRRMLLAPWREYRRNQYLLSSSYHRHSMAKRIPKRVWGRHSALFALMDERLDD
jgi:hypothetical protein